MDTTIALAKNLAEKTNIGGALKRVRPMPIKSSFIYSDELGSFSYGEGHPMRPFRLRLCRELIGALGLDKIKGAEFIPALPASEEDLLLIHTPEYLKSLKEADSGRIPENGPAFGLGGGDNPVFKGVYQWSRLSAGASAEAARRVLEGGGRAFNIAGGLHHAMASRASGFCYINDAALAIKLLLNEGKRVVYVDIDAHHGDGVERAFYDSDQVLTISFHESGKSLFPGTGFSEDRGRGEGLGYSLNVPLPAGTGDKSYLQAFHSKVPGLIKDFTPDVLVTQLGADTLESDPLTHLNLTIRGFEDLIRYFSSLNLPWVALGGGGYDMGATARAWTLAWALMNNCEAPEEIPLDYIKRYPDIFTGQALRGGEKEEEEH